VENPQRPPRPSVVDVHLRDGVQLRPCPDTHLVAGDKVYNTKLRVVRAGLAVTLRSENYLVPLNSVAFVRLSGPWIED
jgi:hypothetical protein